MNNGKILLLIKNHIKEGKLAKCPDSWVAIFPVLIFFENADTRLSFPSFDKLATLAGVGKDKVKRTLESLHEGKWLELSMKERESVKKAICKMVYGRYTPKNSRLFLSLSRQTISSGAWASITPSARKLYLVIKSFCYPRFYADDCFIDCMDLDKLDYDYFMFDIDFNFMQLSVFSSF